MWKTGIRLALCKEVRWSSLFGWSQRSSEVGPVRSFRRGRLACLAWLDDPLVRVLEIVAIALGQVARCVAVLGSLPLTCRAARKLRVSYPRRGDVSFLLSTVPIVGKHQDCCQLSPKIVFSILRGPPILKTRAEKSSGKDKAASKALPPKKGQLNILVFPPLKLQDCRPDW